MANVKISQLTPASALTGAEEIPVVQSGSTKKTTAADIAALGGGGGLGTLDIEANGSVGGPVAITYNFAAAVPATVNGEVSIPVTGVPNINLSSGGGYGGGAFDATTLSFPTLQYAGDFQVYSTSTLQVLSAPALVNISGYTFTFNSNTALTTLNFPSLTKVRGMQFGNTPLLTTLNFPLLAEVEQLQIQNSNPGITGWRQTNFPALRKVTQFNYGYNYLESFEIDLPLLTDNTNGFNGSNSSNLTSVNLPGLINLSGNFGIGNMNQLTNFVYGTVGVTKTCGPAGYNPYISIQNCPLTQASVDGILTVLASLDGTNGTTASNNGNLYLYGGGMAAPSSVGLAARSVLLSRGWYVQTN